MDVKYKKNEVLQIDIIRCSTLNAQRSTPLLQGSELC